VFPFFFALQDDETGAAVSYFMSYNWFRTVGLDITMIFISLIVSGLILDYYNPLEYLRHIFFLLLNRRTAAQHSLYTFMPEPVPLEERITRIIMMAVLCAIVGCFSPVVFMFFSFYVLAFIANEATSNNIFTNLSYINPKIFSRLSVVLQVTYLIFVFTSFGSLLRVFYLVDASKTSLALLFVLVGVFVLLFVVLVVLKHCFFNRHDFLSRQLDRFFFSSLFVLFCFVFFVYIYYFFFFFFLLFFFFFFFFVSIF
jgi:hypothetical protein